jgi:hypothetical protein
LLLAFTLTAMRGVLVFLAALVLAGCGGPDRREIRQEVIEQRYPEAEKKLNKLYSQKDSSTGPGKHALLWHMERGTVDALQGEWLNGLEHFKSAARLAREVRTKSVTRGTAATLINDTLRQYSGEPFEFPFIAYYGMCANLAVAQREQGVVSGQPPVPAGKGAAAEPPAAHDVETYYDRAASASAALEAIQRSTRDQEFGEYHYRDNPFLHLIAAAVRHATARSGDDRQAAMLAAELAWQSYEKAGSIPSLARLLVPYIMAQYDSERAQQVTKTEPSKIAEGEGMLLIVEELGYVPKREALKIIAVTAVPAQRVAIDLGGLFIYIDGPNPDDINQFHGLVVPGELVRQITGGSLGVFGFEMPVMPHPGPRPAAGQALVNGQAVALEIVDDVEAHARSCFDEHKARRLVLILTRTIAKLVGARQGIDQISVNGRHSASAEALHGLLWFLGSAAVTATEQADTRCWTLLPNRIAAAAVRLPAGTHTVAIRRADGVERPLGSVLIRPGALAMLATRDFPAGSDHSGVRDK